MTIEKSISFDILKKIKRQSLRALSFVVLVFAVTGCVGLPPQEDYVLAQSALEAAKASQAARYAPGLMTQAEDFYRQALKNYDDREYKQAKNNFIRARNFAEKAENYTVLKKTESGEL